METKYIADQTFQRVDYSEKKLNALEYEYCIFLNCEFSKTTVFNSYFLETKFIDCNFSNANLNQSSFQNVVFNDCKMLGLKFEECNAFNFSALFKNCRLDHSSFFQMNLQRTQFLECELRETGFTEAKLKGTQLVNCDLLHARFENTNLEKADLTGSFNYSIDPDLNHISGATFSFPEVIGLLDKFDIKINTKG